MGNSGSRDSSLAHGRIDLAIECIWLLTIFIVPLVFNPFSLNAWYFTKALALVFLVCTMLGLVVARWLLTIKEVRTVNLLRLTREHPLQAAAVAFGLVWIVSTLLSIMPFKSIWGNLGGSVGLPPNLAWVVFFLIVADRVKSRAQIFRALYVLLISSGLVSLIGIIQYLNPGILPWFRFQGRVFSTDGNPLFLSAFLSMCLPITLAMIILNWYGSAYVKRNTIFFSGLMAIFGLQLCCLALAQYSLTLLLFIVGIFIFFALISVLQRKKTVVILSAIFLVILAIIAGVLLGPMLIPVTGGEVPGSQAGISTAEQVGLPTISIRVQAWKAAASIIAESPEIAGFEDKYHWLRRAIGYGPETLVAVAQARFPDTLKSRYTFDSTVIAQPENHYLFLGVTIGILGLLVFLLMLALFFIQVFRLLMNHREGEISVIVAAFTAAIVQYCVYILLNDSVITSELVFWLVLGLTVVMARMQAHAVNGPAPAAHVQNDSIGSAGEGPGWLRKSLAVLTVIASVGVGMYLTVPPLVANMKIQAGLNIWGKDKVEALKLTREATLIEPHQSYYLNFAGSVAFASARAEREPKQKTELLKTGETFYLEAVKREPQMAVWLYRLGDLDTYWAANGNPDKLTEAFISYRKADRIFPGNAVILNKWAMALMLSEDFAGAEAKLAESERSDPTWVQTKYYEGLLKAVTGNDAEAARLLMSEGSNAYDSVRYFIDFCDIGSEYGQITLVKDTIKKHIESAGNNWMPVAFLGIASVYDGAFDQAAAEFRHSADLVPPREKGILAGAVQAMVMRNAQFQQAGGEIIDMLMRPAVNIH